MTYLKVTCEKIWGGPIFWSCPTILESYRKSFLISKRVYFLEQDLTAMSGSASDSVFQEIPNTIEYHKSHSEGTGLLKGTAHERVQLKFNLANRFISSGKTRDAKFKSVTDCHFGDKNGHSASRYTFLHLEFRNYEDKCT